MRHLLVTNDFPPKVGGIQSYLYELWRRLPPERFAVVTTAHPGARRFDASLGFRVERVESSILLPTRQLRRRIEALAQELDARLVVLDPALPLGLLGRDLPIPYAVVLHGAEITVPARVPLLRPLLARVLAGARLLIAAGDYPAREARALAGRTTPETVVVPPGVDPGRFRPLTPAARSEARRAYGLRDDEVVVVSVSRLVPRKGMDVLIEATARLASEGLGLRLVIGGSGRDAPRLERLIRRLRAPARLLGAVDEDGLPRLTGLADVAAMCCRTRWLGLEQEGFGIVFLEAAACGVPQLAGRSGGAEDAVVDGVTGLVVDRPADTVAVAAALRRLVVDADLRAALGAAAHERAVGSFNYAVLAGRLAAALAAAGG
ncbi:MAG TPA: glycosyltransferase family 4 protein [Acidimicrobiales bacterium]|nr:glycosyltransferase family 4 protein [Acidimicrobiales bacterium]